jgi:hypothetical protein
MCIFLSFRLPPYDILIFCQFACSVLLLPCYLFLVRFLLPFSWFGVVVSVLPRFQYLLSKFRVQRSVQTYVDISGDDRCEMSARSISVSKDE